MTGRGEPVRIIGMQTTAAFFDVFDAPPLLGRTYHEATDKPGAAVAVISETIWKQQFGVESGGDRHAGPAERRADRDHRRRAGVRCAIRRRAMSGCCRRSTCRRRHSASTARTTAATCTTSASWRASPAIASWSKRQQQLKSIGDQHRARSPGQRRQHVRRASRWRRAWSPTCARRCSCCSARSASCC